jgi:hypothetical protein
MKASEAFKDLPATPEQVVEFSRLIILELRAEQIDAVAFKDFLNGLRQFMNIIRPTLDELTQEQFSKAEAKDYAGQDAWAVQRFINVANCEIYDWTRRKERAERALKEVTNEQ